MDKKQQAVTPGIHWMDAQFDVREMKPDAGTFTAYASVFNQLVPGYNEIVLPGSFTQTLNHRNGTNSIFYEHTDWIGQGQGAVQDSHGLLIEGKLAIKHHHIAQGVYELMQLAHEVNNPAGVSIGFMPIKVSAGSDYAGTIPGISDLTGITMIHEVQLFENSILAPDMQAAQGANVLNLRQSRMRQFITQAMGEMGSSAASALEAGNTTPGAMDAATEARLWHSVENELSNVLEKLRRA